MDQTEKPKFSGLTKEEASAIVDEVKDHVGEHRPFIVVVGSGEQVTVMGHICCQTCATELLAKGIIKLGKDGGEFPEPTEVTNSSDLASMLEKMLGGNKNITVVSVKPTTSNTDGPTP